MGAAGVLADEGREAAERVDKRAVECELAELDRALANADDDSVLGENTSVVEGVFCGGLLRVLALGDADAGLFAIPSS